MSRVINDFIITTDEFDCIEIFDRTMLSGIQMTSEEAELILEGLREAVEILKINQGET